MRWMLLLLLGLSVGLLGIPVTKGYLGKRRSDREFPAEAARLGLERDGPTVPGDLGIFKGEYRDHRVVIRPDASGQLWVSLAGEPVISLSTEVNTISALSGLQPFVSGDSEFDKLFAHRLASPQLAERLVADATLRSRLVAFPRSHKEVRSFSVDDQSVSCNLGFTSFFSYIPVERLEPLLDELIELANFLATELR